MDDVRTCRTKWNIFIPDLAVVLKRKGFQLTFSFIKFYNNNIILQFVLRSQQSTLFHMHLSIIHLITILKFNRISPKRHYYRKKGHSKVKFLFKKWDKIPLDSTQWNGSTMCLGHNYRQQNGAEPGSHRKKI